VAANLTEPCATDAVIYGKPNYVATAMLQYEDAGIIAETARGSHDRTSRMSEHTASGEWTDK